MKMLEVSEYSISKADKCYTLPSDVENSDTEMVDVENNENISSLWSIEDDTMFSAQGLKHHSAGEGKSVYVTWNENYLLNFVFKTSDKMGTTTLTKVRIPMPTHDQQVEEISNMLILEMNTLLYMKSGRVYYFSSVKSMHKIDWLSGIRCVASCPLTQFSVIRVVRSLDHGEQDHKQILSLEVYKDVPQLGKCFRNNVLMHTYNISFDIENLFNCEWLDETYNLKSLITDERNIAFLKLLVSIGNIFRSQEEVIDLDMNQEIHLFTISGNVFVLVGATVSEDEFTSSNTQVETFDIRLLNTYACPVECIHIDCESNLLIVLLQSGHIDVWYKSTRMFGALLHCQHELSSFIYYDFRVTKNTFYFTTPEEIIQLEIILRNSIDIEKECIMKETRKSVGGMIACTFVEGLQQLICLSINNIFYRINFKTLPDTLQLTNENETNYENLNNLYALNDNRVNDLMHKAQIYNELLEQPKYLHNAMEEEFRKQQILALESKGEIFRKLFQCHIEYHTHLPGIEYFDKEYVHIKATSRENQHMNAESIFCLIFMSLKNNKNNFVSSILTATIWHLHISSSEQCIQLYIPYKDLSKKLCFIVEMPMEEYVKQVLPKFSLKLLTFYNHQYQSICLKYNLDLDTNEKTYLNLFSYNIQSCKIFRNSVDDVINVLTKQSKLMHISTTKWDENVYKLKQRYKIPKTVLKNVIRKLVQQALCSLTTDFKIYFLHQYLIELNYDDCKEMLLICSNYPVAIFYIKLLLVNAMQSYNDIDVIDTSVHNMQQMILNYQNDIEHLYGSLSSDSDDVNSDTISMHLENLRNVYLKLRMDFYDIFR